LGELGEKRKYIPRSSIREDNKESMAEQMYSAEREYEWLGRGGWRLYLFFSSELKLLLFYLAYFTSEIKFGKFVTIKISLLQNKGSFTKIFFIFQLNVAFNT